MTLMLITFGIFLLLMALMAIGVIVANKPIKGSCGGLSTLGLKDGCMICGGGDKNDPFSEVQHKDMEHLFYDATAEKTVKKT
ncbi:(Na+)-NQR maturation NqrM [Endozoicomonas sp. 8E]|uniref:(Na+)-NQR maturation NqrM n=1 Tax=Endozoicomonas sp. 8E TaxID=3035692 RepID=UPI002939003F|nr:(Na+)-NQR maturation NqrM [Endozoicomonas sp. 8E]WOG25733.1 (Na+)-NQR maturation NqrM [Endozoicomonas sp. 8E]